MTKFDTQIKHIMAHFDFSTVAKIMQIMNWKYYDSPNPPTVARIKSLAKYHLKAAARPDTLASHAGRLQARKLKDEFGKEYLVLEFSPITESAEGAL